MARATGFLWATTWITSTVLVAGAATYDIGFFPRQSDMPAGFDWLRPANDADNIDDAAELTPGSNGFAGGYGGPTIKWALRGLRPKMVDWIVTNKFPGGVFTYPATIAVPSVRNKGVTRYYQALADRTEFTAAQLAIGGLDMWVVNFVDATEIAAP